MGVNADSIAQIGDAGGDPVASAGKAITIKDMMDREQLNKLQLGQAKTDAAANSKIQDLLKGENVDYSNPEGVMRTAQKINQISPKASLEFQQTAQKYQSGKVQAQVDQYELLDHQQGVIVSAIDPIVAQARAMKNGGADDMTVNAYVQQQLPGALTTLRDTKLPNGQSALSPEVIKQVQAASAQGPMTLSTLEGFESKSKQGQAAIKQRLEQLKADTATKKENETERENRGKDSRDERRLDQADRRIAITQQKAAPTPEGRSNLLAAMAERGVNLPTGLRNKETQNATLDGLIRNNPDKTPAQLADLLATGNLTFKAQGKESTTLATRQAGISAIENTIIGKGGFLDQAEQAVNAVNFPKLKAAGQFENWSKEQQSDPDLSAYRASIAELRQEYAIVLSKGGQVTDASRHEASEVVPDIITPAQFAKIKGVIKNGIQTAKSGVEDALNESEGKPATRPGQSTSGAGAGAGAGGPPPPPGFVVQ